MNRPHGFRLFFSLSAILSSPWLASDSIAQAALSGYVRTLAGDPIEGASVRLVTLNQTRTTNASGFYDFGSTAGLASGPGLSGYRMVARPGRLQLTLERNEKVTLELAGLSGRRAGTLVDGLLTKGSHSFPIVPEGRAGRVLLLKAKVGAEVAWHKWTLGEGFTALSAGNAPEMRLLRKPSAADSVVVTHPNYSGGLAGLHARRIPATTGVQNFRMFSTDAGWDIAVPQITFSISSDAGGARFKQLVPNYQEDVRFVLREVVQSIWRTPGEIPTNKRHKSYRINIQPCDGVASAGGTTIDFCTGHIADQGNNRSGWLEVMGVLIHESAHTYQPYYSTSGAEGFGEAVPDAIRALTGYFSWRAAGSKCAGGYQEYYQDGGRYWLYIEYKHPGFISGIYKNNSGDIGTRVQAITGQALGALAKECESSGMPPGAG